MDSRMEYRSKRQVARAIYPKVYVHTIEEIMVEKIEVGKSVLLLCSRKTQNGLIV